MGIFSLGVSAVERGLVPDALTRAVIRRMCRQRLRDEQLRVERGDPVHEQFLASLRNGPIAIETDAANDQHYELPSEFFMNVLGPARKYSCCYFETPAATLAEAEAAALNRSCQMADLQDGQAVLELGCGWGSLSLWMAERYPRCRITAVSNSSSQREFIAATARSRGLTNLQLITCDINEFDPGTDRFDRVVSVEMFEHMRNYERLLTRISSWLRPAGRLYVHHFCHRTLSYPFESEGTSNWMGRHFFTGGMMPCNDLLTRYPDILQVLHHDTWSGRHYQQTADAWLENLDARRSEVIPILAKACGPADAERWFHRWRMFFLAVSELFGYAEGREWQIAHTLLARLD